MEKAEEYDNRICIIYRKEDVLSQVACRFLKWLFNIIYRIPTDIYEERDIEMLELIERGEHRANYIMVFLLSTISGARPSNTLWEKLSEADGVIPIVAFYRSAYVLAQHPIGEISST